MLTLPKTRAKTTTKVLDQQGGELVTNQPTKGKNEKRAVKSQQGGEFQLLRQTVAKRCLRRTDIFITHLPSRADAAQNAQLMREWGTDSAGARCSAEQSPWSPWKSAHPTLNVDRGFKKTEILPM